MLCRCMASMKYSSTKKKYLQKDKEILDPINRKDRFIDKIEHFNKFYGF